jgi:uncharacterized protein YbjT (DUF2867 family)
MRVLLLGASGLIGSAVLARLVSDGHEVIGIARRPGAARPNVKWQSMDIAQAVRPDDWRPLLENADAVANCAGVLQSGGGQDVRGVHVEGIAALYEACETAGVRRIVHVSALGADDVRTPFSESKRKGEETLTRRDLDWVILRPSVVLGRPAYGGSALIRGLAALPVHLEFPQTGPLQVVQLADLVETVAFLLRPGAPARLVLDVAGPGRLSLDEVVRVYRRWLRFPPARSVRLPAVLLRAGCRVGDLLRVLGWRPPIGTTAWRELERGAAGDPGPWQAATGITPVSLEAALAREPVSVQERWFAVLYILRPVILVVLVLFWVLTGLISLGPGWDRGREYLLAGGVPIGVASAGVIAGAVADILIGIGIAFCRTARLALCAAVWLSLFYMVAGTIILPELWSDPVGPMLKIWPVIVLVLVALSTLTDR